MASFAAIRETLIIGLQDIETTRYAQLSSGTIVVFDHLLTLEDEVSLIWNNPWSFVKILFLINRYYIFASMIFNNYSLFSTTLTDEFCLRMFHWQGWTGLIACMLSEAILQIRIYALYSWNKKVLMVMLICYIICSASSAWIIGTELASISVTSILPTGGRFCIPTGIPRRFYIFWIPMLSFESLLCSLALFQGFRTFRPDGSIFGSGRTLARILVRDSTYFLVICATYLTCLLMWATARRTLMEVPVGFSVAMSCVLANRVTLNVLKISQSVGLGSKSSTRRFSDDSAQYELNSPSTRFDTLGTLSVLEMGQLRAMRAEKDFDSF